MSSVLSSISGILFWWQKPHPQYAHPWSAYAAPTYLAGNAPIGVVIATKVHQLAAPSSETRRLAKASIDASQAGKTNSAQPEKPKQSTVPLQLVMNETQNDNAVAVVPAGLMAATGQNFLLAARLQGVNKLNRPVATHAARSSKRKGAESSSNRPVRKTLTAKRMRGIDPPAVLRKKRQSAEVIRLNLVLARTENSERRARRAA